MNKIIKLYRIKKSKLFNGFERKVLVESKLGGGISIAKEETFLSIKKCELQRLNVGMEFKGEYWGNAK